MRRKKKKDKKKNRHKQKTQVIKISLFVCFMYKIEKILLYKTILIPTWTYGTELWGCAKPTNTKIYQTLQSKILRLITNCPCCVYNQTVHEDLKVLLVNEVITTWPTKYKNLNHGHQIHLLTNCLKHMKQ